MDISIIIPVYNELLSIEPLYAEIVGIMNTINKTYEIIFIDDGSCDGSSKVLENISKKAKGCGIKLVYIKFRKNFGKSEALMTGFKEAQGDIIITMDGDQQDDPKEIPNFLKEIESGYDLVSGWKFKRRDSIFKTFPSKIINTLTAWLTGAKLHDMNCCFKAYRKEVAKDLNIYGELHRFIPALVFQKGFKISEIKVNHRPRLTGKSKYGFKRFFEGFFDLITVVFLTRFIRKPMHFFGNFGLISSFLGFSIIAIFYLRKFFFGIIIGQHKFLFLIAMLLIVVGFQFFSLGLLGELLVRVNSEEVKKDYEKA